MDVKKVLLLVGALLIAGVTAFFARSMMAGSAAPAAVAAQAEVKGPHVLVATRPLPAGTIIDPEAIAFQPWPEDMVDKAYFLKEGTDPATLTGKVMRYAVSAGQPVTTGAVVGPGERGFLAAALGQGMRAITVTVSDSTGVAGFVFPGDRVDLMLTQQVGGEEASLKVTETIMRNVRVLAVDQRVDNPENKPDVGRTMTFEVTPKYAEKIVVAQTVGTLSLALRSLADNAAEIDRAIAAGEIEVGDNDSAADKAMELALAAKPTDANPTYTVGGEVSRFQRSSVPPVGSSGGDGAPAAAAAPRPSGPVVRVARGNEVTEVPLGAK